MLPTSGLGVASRLEFKSSIGSRAAQWAEVFSSIRSGLNARAEVVVAVGSGLARRADGGFRDAIKGGADNAGVQRVFLGKPKISVR